MQKRFTLLAICVMVVLGVACAAYASSLDDAKTLAEKAAAYVKTNGREKGLAEIGNPKGQFVKGDLYVIAVDFNGNALGNPTQPKLQSVNLLNVRDADNHFFIKEAVDIAKTKGSGWLTYKWTNPATKKVQSKKSWIQRVEGHDIWVMCGVFQ